VPAGKATAAAMLNRRGVSTAIVFPDGTTRRILRTDLLNPDEALFAPVFLLAGMIIAAQKQMLYLFEEPGGETLLPRKPFQIVVNPL
jgi:hypothetical protein